MEIIYKWEEKTITGERKQYQILDAWGHNV